MKLKEIKKNAHKNVKAHYATYLVLCLAAVLMGVNLVRLYPF